MHYLLITKTSEKIKKNKYEKPTNVILMLLNQQFSPTTFSKLYTSRQK